MSRQEDRKFKVILTTQGIQSQPRLMSPCPGKKRKKEGGKEKKEGRGKGEKEAKLFFLSASMKPRQGSPSRGFHTV